MQIRHSLFPLLLFGARIAAGAAADDAQDHTLKFADNKLQLKIPDKWQKRPPANRVIEFEFAVPKAEEDENDGRVTLAGAGGSIEANLERWKAQFETPDGGAAKAKVTQQKIAGCDVHLLDISGTFKDKPPNSGTEVRRTGYRMLSAIVASKDEGNYFIKFYGPQRTVTENEKAFAKMIDSLERK
jgi:gluconolactonase